MHLRSDPVHRQNELEDSAVKSEQTTN